MVIMVIIQRTPKLMWNITYPMTDSFKYYNLVKVWSEVSESRLGTVVNNIDKFYH